MSSRIKATTAITSPSMSTPVQTIESLTKLGVMIADAAKGQSVDWSTFLTSPDYQAIQGSISQLTQNLGKRSIEQTVNAIEQKQHSLLAGGKLIDLPNDKLLQYSDLGILKFKLQAARGLSGDFAIFAKWLLDDALPVLLKVAPIVIPLLL
jgi:hypothetical protein